MDCLEKLVGFFYPRLLYLELVLELAVYFQRFYFV